MLRLAVSLVHNKATNLANRQQITNLLALVVPHSTSTPDPLGGPDIVYTWYTLSNVTTEHEAIFYQVLPTGVTSPTNLYDLDSCKVLYGVAAFVGEHPRFFNWLLKRGTNDGADVVIYVRFPTLFSASDLEVRLQLLLGDRDIALLEPAWGKLATRRCLREVGQLLEDRDFDAAIDDLKARILARNLRTG